MAPNDMGQNQYKKINTSRELRQYENEQSNPKGEQEYDVHSRFSPIKIETKSHHMKHGMSNRKANSSQVSKKED